MERGFALSLTKYVNEKQSEKNGLSNLYDLYPVGLFFIKGGGSFDVRKTEWRYI